MRWILEVTLISSCKMASSHSNNISPYLLIILFTHTFGFMNFFKPFYCVFGVPLKKKSLIIYVKTLRILPILIVRTGETKIVYIHSYIHTHMPCIYIHTYIHLVAPWSTRMRLLTKTHAILIYFRGGGVGGGGGE